MASTCRQEGPEARPPVSRLPEGPGRGPELRAAGGSSSGRTARRAPAPAVDTALLAAGFRRFERVQRTSSRFFEEQAGALAEAFSDLAGRLAGGGRLLVFGSRACASDVHHVATEFDDPVLVGAPAFPTIALHGPAAPRVRLLAKPIDAALGVTPDGEDPDVVEGLVAARRLGLLTIGLCGADGGRMADTRLHHFFCVPDGDPTVVQDVHKVVYHLMGEFTRDLMEARP